MVEITINNLPACMIKILLLTLTMLLKNIINILMYIQIKLNISNTFCLC